MSIENFVCNRRTHVKYIGDRKTKLKDYIIPSTQHIKEYTSIGRDYKNAYLTKNKKRDNDEKYKISTYYIFNNVYIIL